MLAVFSGYSLFVSPIFTIPPENHHETSPYFAPHPENAHAFINFLMGAEIGRDLAEYIEYATSNAAARALMDDSYNKNPAIFPPDDVLAQLEPSLYLGEERTQLIDEEWTRVLAS